VEQQWGMRYSSVQGLREQNGGKSVQMACLAVRTSCETCRKEDKSKIPLSGLQGNS
jgi:hypothetical protein